MKEKNAKFKNVIITKSIHYFFFSKSERNGKHGHSNGIRLKRGKDCF